MIFKNESGISHIPGTTWIRYLSGQFPSQFLPLRAWVQKPKQDQKIYSIEHLLPGEYEFGAWWPGGLTKQYRFTIPSHGSQVERPWPFD